MTSPDRNAWSTLASPAYGKHGRDWLAAASMPTPTDTRATANAPCGPGGTGRSRPSTKPSYDEFPSGSSRATSARPTHEQILATGFNRNHMINGEGGRIAEENRVEYVFDMTETMGTLWMGLTLNCARCHDHKFDPLTQREYYQLTAFFNQTPVNGGGGDPQTKPVLQASSTAQNEELARMNAEIVQVEEEIVKRRGERSKDQAQWEARMLKNLPRADWTRLLPRSAEARF